MSPVVPEAPIAIPARAARPTAPPSCCAAFTSPLSSPDSSSALSRTAIAVALTAPSPSPAPIRTNAPTRLRENPVVVGSSASHRKPVSSTARAKGSARRSPRRRARTGEATLPTMIVPASGSWAIPAASGLIPSTSCWYCGRKKKRLTSVPPISSITTFAVTTGVLRKTPSGTSGWVDRPSTTTNAAREARPTASPRTVPADDQPTSDAETMPRASPEMPRVIVTAPSASNRPGRPGTGRTERHTTTAPTTPNGTGARNTACQPSTWVRVPPRKTPRRLPRPATAPQTPVARVRSAGVG